MSDEPAERQTPPSRGRTIALLLALAVAVPTGIGFATHNDHAERVAEWATTLTQVKAMTLEETLRLAGPGATDVGKLEAAVFPRGVATPDTTHPEWVALVAVITQHAELAASKGWVLDGTGYADDTGSDPVNARVSADRARISVELLAAAVGYPRGLTASRGAGVTSRGDTTQAARKVVVKFTHA